MKLDLINNETVLDYEFDDKRKIIKFNFFKNLIKKDLEVVLWHNKATKVFGDFQIYSDFSSELNSFDFIVSYLTGNVFDVASEAIEAGVSSKCSEHFLSCLITQGFNLEKNEVEQLSTKYTNYILEACEIILNNSNESLHRKLEVHENNYFIGDNPPEALKYINPQYLN